LRAHGDLRCEQSLWCAVSGLAISRGPRSAPTAGGYPPRPLPGFGYTETAGSRFGYLAALRQPGMTGYGAAPNTHPPQVAPQTEAHRPITANSAQHFQSAHLQTRPTIPRHEIGDGVMRAQANTRWFTIKNHTEPTIQDRRRDPNMPSIWHRRRPVVHRPALWSAAESKYATAPCAVHGPALLASRCKPQLPIKHGHHQEGGGGGGR
jgi:hypothetical protein